MAVIDSQRRAIAAENQRAQNADKVRRKKRTSTWHSDQGMAATAAHEASHANGRPQKEA